MTTKIKIKRPLQHCAELKALLKKHNLSAEPLFPKNPLLFQIDGTDTAVRRQLKECPDVKAFILDRENHVPIL